MSDYIDTRAKIIEFQKLHGNCFGSHRKIIVNDCYNNEITLEKFNLLKNESGGFFNYDLKYSFFYREDPNIFHPKMIEDPNFENLLSIWKKLGSLCSVIYTKLFPYLQYKDIKIKIYDFDYQYWKLYDIEGTK